MGASFLTHGVVPATINLTNKIKASSGPCTRKFPPQQSNKLENQLKFKDKQRLRARMLCRQAANATRECTCKINSKRRAKTGTKLLTKIPTYNDRDLGGRRERNLKWPTFSRVAPLLCNSAFFGHQHFYEGIKGWDVGFKTRFSPNN